MSSQVIATELPRPIDYSTGRYCPDFQLIIQVRKVTAMADKFDPYREALVMETTTVWPDEYDHLGGDEKLQISDALHADPQSATNLKYVRTHSGFCREITVTEEDVDRVTAS